jgi:hypothetical protein
MPNATDWCRIGAHHWKINERGWVLRGARGRTDVLADGGKKVTNAELLALPDDGEVWMWLRSHGVRRPSPSGKSGTQLTDAQRGSRPVRLSDATIDRADELAAQQGCSRAEAISRAVLAALR